MQQLLKAWINKVRPQQAIHPVKNNRGMAMMLAISTVALIIYLAMEVMYDTTVEYNVNSQELNRLKGYYAARGAMDLALLRIKIYQNIRNKLGDAVKSNPYIDQIWTFPMQWPIPLGLLGSYDKSAAQEKSAESLMDAEYTMEIQDEGSKIDINDLGSPSETIRKNTERMLRNFFEEKVKSDDEFRNNYGSFRFDDLINQIKDFMSPKWTSASGGDKRSGYAEMQSPEYPPNRGFRTIGELRLVPMMNDELFSLLEPRITVFGLKAVNPNTASSIALQTLDSGIDASVAQAIITQRQKQPFDSPADFYSFVVSKSAQKLQARNVDEWPLTMDTLTSFRVTTTGSFASVSREITTIVVDINSAAKRIKTFLDKEKQQDPNNPQSPGAPTTPPPKKPPETLPKGAPRIVYWYER